MASHKVNNYQIAGDIDISTTGTINDLDMKGYHTLIMTNATDATITGIVAGYPGQQITIISAGAGNVYLANNSGSSAAANRLINDVTIPTPLAAGYGRAIYEYQALSNFWILVNHFQGNPITVAYSAGNFTAGGAQTWTVDSGDQSTYTYMLNGRYMTVSCQLATTSIGGTPNPALKVAIPAGATCNGYTLVLGITIKDAAATTVHESLLVEAPFGSTVINLYLIGAANWPTTTNTTYVYLFITFPIS